ncbi:MAG: DUF1684 domain-containing protein [Chloroflexota bacterium]
MTLTETYEETVLKYRAEREARLRDNERSWLALAGLYWLAEGSNTFGTDPYSDIQIEGEEIPPKAGSFEYKDGVVTLKVSDGANITCNGEPVKTKVLHNDRHESPDFIEIASLTLLVIQRGPNSLIRVWDKAHPARRNFTGLKHYPVKPAYRIAARFVPYEPVRVLRIRDVIGEEYDVEFPGYAIFHLDGRECRLEAEKTEDGLFFNFYDPTNGNGSYPGGRFLDTDPPVDREVVLDFNKARNPPCAYTDYATCPLPPSQNRLPVRIPAGEMIYRHHDK